MILLKDSKSQMIFIFSSLEHIPSGEEGTGIPMLASSLFAFDIAEQKVVKNKIGKLEDFIDFNKMLQVEY